MADQEGARGRPLQLVRSQRRQLRRQERSGPPDLPPVRTGVPPEDAPGLEFRPTDEDLIVFYLRGYVAGRPLPKGVVVVPADVYGTEPWKLLQQGKEEGFFFGRRTRRSANSRWPSRTAGGGSWQAFKRAEEVKSAKDGFGEITVGIKNHLSFKHGEVKYSGYCMYEYELVDAGDGGEKFQETVLCHVKRTRAGKIQQGKRERPAPTTVSCAHHHDGDVTASSSCDDDPCTPNPTMPLLKKMRGCADHATETTTWTPSSSCMLNRNSAGGVDAVESSSSSSMHMIPQVAAGHMDHYSSSVSVSVSVSVAGETTVVTPLLLPEIQVQYPPSSSASAVEQDCIIPRDEEEEERLMISMDDLFDFLDREKSKDLQDVILVDTPPMSTFPWSEVVQVPSQTEAAAQADHHSSFIHDQNPAAPSSLMSPSSMAAVAVAVAVAENNADPSAQSKDQEDTSKSFLLQVYEEQQHTFNTIMQPSPEEQEQQQQHSRDDELLSFLETTSLTIDDVIVPDLEQEEDGDLNFAALDDIPLWTENWN